MPVGKLYPGESYYYYDKKTKVPIRQLTTFPTTHLKLYFHVNAFTPDSKSLVFQCFANDSRTASADIFRVDTDGRNLVKLTESVEAASPVVSPDGKWLYYLCKGELRRTGMNDYKEEAVGHINGIKMSGILSANTAGTTVNASMSPDGKVYFTDCTLKNGNRAILRYETDGGRADVIYENSEITHTQCEPTKANTVAFQFGPDDKHRNIWFIDQHGSNLRPCELPYGNGHWMWHGNTHKIMSCMEKNMQGITIMGEGDKEPEIIAAKNHYWHACSNRTGEWIISDTNWPDIGLILINTKTKKQALLCESLSSNAHPQWTHPHPSFSPDDRYVVFSSDMSGTPHTFAAEIPEELKESLRIED